MALRVNGCGAIGLPLNCFCEMSEPGGQATQFSKRSNGDAPTQLTPLLFVSLFDVMSTTLTSKTTWGAGMSASAMKFRADWMMSGLPLTSSVSVRVSTVKLVAGMTVANCFERSVGLEYLMGNATCCAATWPDWPNSAARSAGVPTT